MEAAELEELQYPIGHFNRPSSIPPLLVKDWIAQIESLPVNLSDLVRPLSQEQLEAPYRPGGWTIRQVIHHLADSHHHSYIRFKWALTEPRPVIKPYLEKSWAQLEDAAKGPIELSLDHLAAIHAKLAYFLPRLSGEELKKVYVHPDGNIEITLEENIGRYAWHGNHHLAHIQSLLERNGWL